MDVPRCVQEKSYLRRAEVTESLSGGMGGWGRAEGTEDLLLPKPKV